MCKTAMDSIIMNDKEMRSPLFNSPLFMQEDLMIYDYLTEGCLFQTKQKKNKDMSPLCCYKNMSFLTECEVIPVCIKCQDNRDKTFC